MSDSSKIRPANGAKVSVLMQIWNADPDDLMHAVQSVLNQSFTDFELVVSEDPSPRAAADVLKSFSDSRLRHVLHRSRASMGAARNRALRLTSAELVAIHDADDVSAPDRLEQQYAFLSEHPEVAVAGSQIAILSSSGERLGCREYPTSHDEILDAMPRYNPLAQPSVMFRKSVVIDAGGYDEDPARVCEDYELWSRLAHRGLRFANLADALLGYRLHAGAMKRRRLRASLRDTLAIKRRHWSTSRSLAARMRTFGERCLVAMPPSVVYWLFQRMTLKPCKDTVRRSW